MRKCVDIPRENTCLVKKQVKHMFAYVFCLQWCRCSGRSAPCQVCCKPNRKATDLKNAAFRELRESIKPYGLTEASFLCSCAAVPSPGESVESKFQWKCASLNSKQGAAARWASAAAKPTALEIPMPRGPVVLCRNLLTRGLYPLDSETKRPRSTWNWNWSNMIEHDQIWSNI